MSDGAPFTLVPPLGRILWVVVLAISGCSGGTTESQDEEPLGPCPPPGAGVSISGVGGIADAVTTPLPRLVLMGGGAEYDEASLLFLEAAQGGDILVLRASGSLFTYPNYFFYALTPAIRPSAVNTILTNPPASGADPGVLCRIAYAEAIWLAGGNQWDYLGRWPSELHQALADFIEDGGAMGGTSAGAVSLGEAAFDAEAGSVTSAGALADPLSSQVSLSYPIFSHPDLANTLVDSHFTQRDREGRLMVFLARFLEEKGRAQVVGVGLDEEAALILEEGTFQVLGPAGTAVWVYRVTGPATLSVGQALSLEGIRRVRLEPGSQGSWPLDFDVYPGVDLTVEGGVLGPG